jgi:ZIP family zinc transporter
MDHNVMFAFALTLFAGLSTGIGSVIAFVGAKDSKKFLSVGLGFSAGVMIYVSLTDIMQKALVAAQSVTTDFRAHAWVAGSFFAGVLLSACLDRMIPHDQNPHEMLDYSSHKPKKKSLMRMGVFVALVLALHNFPEGLATFIAALHDPVVGVSIAIAIALHNIPEGVAVSVPIYHATGSKKKAFLYSFLSGLAEPVGAIIGYLILMPYMTPLVMAVVFAMLAGIMVFISLDELFPAAREYGEHHIAIYGLFGGMAIMALSLVIIRL